MKRSSRPRKTASNLSESVHQQLNVYALAATAGVGLALIPSAAEAKVVYTPTHIAIQFDHPLNIDIDGDGHKDVRFDFYEPSRSLVGLFVSPVNRKNQIWGIGNVASALPNGVRIASDAHFQDQHSVMFYAYRGIYGGDWLNVTDRYLGIKFVICGKIHYGWARLTVDHYKSKIVLTGYAYQTIPNKAIIAGKTHGPGDDLANEDFDASMTNPIPDTPQPLSLGMLALGAQGVPLWRRKESALEGN